MTIEDNRRQQSGFEGNSSGSGKEISFLDCESLIVDGGRRYEQITSAIPVDKYLERFEIKDEHVIEMMHRFPVLVYGLGKYAEDGKLVEGTGFWNVHPNRIDSTKGLINHTLGTARIAEKLITDLQYLSDDQVQIFRFAGIRMDHLRKLHPQLIRDYILISHFGDVMKQDAKKEGKTGLFETDRAALMDNYLKNEQADEVWSLLMLGEKMHIPYILGEPTEQSWLMKGKMSYPFVLVQQYPDWRFQQTPIALSQRFENLAQNYSNAPYLEILNIGARNFETALRRTMGDTYVDTLGTMAVPFWEVRIRSAWAAHVQKSPTELWKE